MVKKFVILLFLFSALSSQMNQDARMMGLNGSYTTLARGFRAVGINPANLAVYPIKSLNIMEFSMGFSNNFFSIKNYNTLSGSHLNDIEHENYYPKEKILDEFGGRGLRMRQLLIFPLPALNISTNRMALTSRVTSNLDIGLSDGMVQFLFLGNPLGKDNYIDIEEVFLSTQEMGFSYGHSFRGYSAGFTVKYLLGLFYMGMEPLSSPTITTDPYGYHGNLQYLIRQAIGGNGIGLDVGLTTDEFDNGYRFGMSITNLLGTIKWTQDNYIREQLEPKMSKEDYYLRPNEFVYINMVIDSITIQTIENIDSLDYPLIYYETYQVIPLETLDYLSIESEDSALVIGLSDGTYLYPSGGNYKKYILLGAGEDTTYAISDDNYSEYSSSRDNSFTTRQPMYFRLGISKRWEGQAVVAVDLVTGFSNRLNSSSNWRLSVGTEITRFNNKFLRLGYAVGGMAGKSLSFGYGVKLGGVYFDIGLSLHGGFSLDSTKGLDLAGGIIWKLD